MSAGEGSGLVLLPGTLGEASSVIWPSVREVFYPWTAQYEGVIFWMYADILGLVTTGVGNLIDPVGLALPLPWQRPDGSAASEGEIRDAWQAVKDSPDAARLGAGYARGLTDLTLSEGAVVELVDRRLLQNADVLASRFPGFWAWPADAQLATLSMAWAMGPGFDFPRFADAVDRLDFVTAAAECTIREAGNPGVVPRNQADRALFLAAADVLATDGDPSRLTFDYSGLRRPKAGPAAPLAVRSRVPWGAVGLGLAVGVVGLALVAPGTLTSGLASIGQLAASLVPRRKNAA